MFATITVIADGVLDSANDVPENEIDETIEFLRSEIAADPDVGEWRIYRLDHDHDEGIECDCLQYATDHAPIYSSSTSS